MEERSKKGKKLSLLTICLLLVMAMSLPLPVEAAKPKLNRKKVTLYVNGTVRLKVVKGKKGKVKWKSSNPKVAKVSKKGKVRAKKVGTAIITAKVKGKKVKCKIIVKKKTSRKITRRIRYGVDIDDDTCKYAEYLYDKLKAKGLIKSYNILFIDREDETMMFAAIIENHPDHILATGWYEIDKETWTITDTIYGEVL